MNATEILQSSFVTVPALRIEEHGDDVLVSNTAVGTKATFSREILAIIAFFETPQPLSQWLKRPGACRETLVRAVTLALISDVNRLVGPAKDSIGQNCSLSGFLKDENAGTIALFGAPVDIAATGRGGARGGPGEIRRHFRAPFWGGAQEGGYTSGTAGHAGPEQVYMDFGDVVAQPGEAISTYGPRIGVVVEQILEQGAIPAMLGGDHSCTAFAIQPHLKRNKALGIIHFDAHHDLWAPPAPQYSYVTHANALYGALQSDRVVKLLQLGLRVFDVAFAAQLQDDSRLEYFSAYELQNMSPEKVFAGLPDDIPYYLSFDIDCIDPLVAPETGTPLPGGLSYYQALGLVDYAARNFNLVGWDIVEVAQGQGLSNGAALCAARLARQLMLGTMPFEPLTKYARPL